MSYATKRLLKDLDGRPIPQVYNPDTDAFEPLQGTQSAGSRVNVTGRTGPNEWTVTATSGANAEATATKALEAGKIHIITGYLVVLRAAAAGTDVSVAVKDGATVKIQDYIGNAAPRGTRVGATGLHIACTAAAAANLVAAAAGASAITALTLMGYTIDA